MSDDNKSSGNSNIVDMIPPDDILDYYVDASNLLKRGTSYMLQSSGESLIMMAPGDGDDTMAAISGNPVELGALMSAAFDVLWYNFGATWPREFMATYIAEMPESTRKAVVKRIQEAAGDK